MEIVQSVLPAADTRQPRGIGHRYSIRPHRSFYPLYIRHNLRCGRTVTMFEHPSGNIPESMRGSYYEMLKDSVVREEFERFMNMIFVPEHTAVIIAAVKLSASISDLPPREISASQPRKKRLRSNDASTMSQHSRSTSPITIPMHDSKPIPIRPPIPLQSSQPGAVSDPLDMLVSAAETAVNNSVHPDDRDCCKMVFENTASNRCRTTDSNSKSVSEGTVVRVAESTMTTTTAPRSSRPPGAPLVFHTVCPSGGAIQQTKSTGPRIAPSRVRNVSLVPFPSVHKYREIAPRTIPIDDRQGWGQMMLIDPEFPKRKQKPSQSSIPSNAHAITCARSPMIDMMGHFKLDLTHANGGTNGHRDIRPVQ